MAKEFDVTFIGEDGIDAQGLTREFFSIVMSSLKYGSGNYILFEGSDDHLLPVISEEYHQSSFFIYAGELIAMSVLHAGFGFTGMSRALSVYLSTDDMDRASCYLSIKDVPDYGIQGILCEVCTERNYYCNGNARQFVINNLGSCDIDEHRDILILKNKISITR